jgi:hypothetical protein
LHSQGLMIKFAPHNGQVSEWPKEHAWKVCIPQGIEGSNPSLTAIFIQIRSMSYGFVF